MKTENPCYILFPKGHQPTEAEISKLNEFQVRLGGFNIGIDETSGGLAIEFDQAGFQKVINRSGGWLEFEALIEGWKRMGFQLIERGAWKISFRQDENALRPISTEALKDRREEERAGLRSKHQKLQDAAEREGRMKMQAHAAGQRVENISRASKAVPFLLGGAIALGTVFAGVKLASRLNNAGIEPRKDTVERVAADPMGADPQTQIKKKNPEPEAEPIPFSEKEEQKKDAAKDAKPKTPAR